MILNEIIKTLEEAGIENALREALMLASHVTGKSESIILSDRNAPLTDNSEVEEKLAAAVSRRATREPLQYIIGKWDFMGLPFTVTPDCLIPRGDTELLCETALSRLPQNGKFLDLCTGSGCIAVAVAHHRPDVDVTALEKYRHTLDIAKKNAENLVGKDRIKFIEADVTSHLSAVGYFCGKKFDFIAANPPYVSLNEMDGLEPELSHEPRHALTDESDGLSIIRAIVSIYPMFLSPDGYLAIEHGATQGEAVRHIMISKGFRAETLYDLSGNERITIMRKHEYH